MALPDHAVLPKQATRALYSDIDGTLAHYMDMVVEENGSKLVGEGISMQQEPNNSKFSGAYLCKDFQVLL